MAIESDLIEFESNDNNNNNNNNDNNVELSKESDSQIENVQVEEEEVPRTTSEKKPNIRELLRLSRDLANLKLASIQGTNNLSRLEVANITANEDETPQKIVLIGKESPVWNCPVTTKKLIRKAVVIKDTRSSIKTSETQAHSSTQPQTTARFITATRSHYDYFVIVRTEFDNFREIEANRLKRRLEKLSDYSSEIHKPMSFSEFEKSIVPWEDDSSSNSCYICSKAFSPLFNRKHHCRLCGRLICASGSGSEEINCLETIPIKLVDQRVENLKSCSKCYSLLFKKTKHLNHHQNQTHLQSNLTKINSLYTSINHLKAQILEMIPKFNELLQRFDELDEVDSDDTKKTVKAQWKHDIWALRDTLILISLHMRSTTRELINLAEIEALTTPIWRIFANNFRRCEGLFIQKHMFTLQILNTTTTRKNENYEKMNITDELNRNKDSGIDSTASSTSTMGKIKRLLPTVLTDAFASSVSEISALSLESLALYDIEGNLLTNPLPISANSVALHEKETALLEQMEQLQQFHRSATDDPDHQAALMEAIQEAEAELKKLKRYKK